MEVKTLNLKIYKVYELTKDIIYYASCACVCACTCMWAACTKAKSQPQIFLRTVIRPLRQGLSRALGCHWNHPIIPVGWAANDQGPHFFCLPSSEILCDTISGFMYRLKMGFHVCAARTSRSKLHLQLSSSLLDLELYVIPGLLVTLGLWQRLCALYAGGSSLPRAVLLRFLCLET